MQTITSLVIGVTLFSITLHAQDSRRPPVATPRLTNDSIVQMHKAGLGDGIIIAKIKTSVCEFDTAAATLVELKTAGVSEPVILAMIDAIAPPPPNTNGAEKRSATHDKAILHFYRERAFTGSARTMPIYIDEVQVADLVNGRQFSMTVEPGKHVFRCRTKPEAIDVEIELGKDYYLRAELIQGFTKNHWRIVQVAEKQGELDVQRLKPLDAEHIAPLARTAH